MKAQELVDEFVEHSFVQGPATLWVDLKKKSNYTQYKFCLKLGTWNIRKMDPNNLRLNLAFQWFTNDFTYDSAVFKMKVPAISRQNSVLL